MYEGLHTSITVVDKHVYFLQSAPRVSPTRIDVQLKALESTNSALASRITSLEETTKMSNNLVNEILIQLRQLRDEMKALRVGDLYRILTFIYSKLQI